MRGATMRKEPQKAINKMRQLHEEGKTIEEIAELLDEDAATIEQLNDD